MPLITWNHSFSVEVPEMDKQHQALLDILNQLHDAMLDGKGSRELGAIIDRMLAYAEFHFRAEEQLLSTAQYPQLAKQKTEHQFFVKKVKSFEQEMLQGKLGLSLQVMAFLKDWLTKHIQDEDKKYGQILAHHSLGQKATHLATN